MQKMFSRSSLNPEARIFIHYTTGKTNLFLISKNMLIVMVPILTNKNMFEPTYSDLKFTVQNHNYSFPPTE